MSIIKKPMQMLGLAPKVNVPETKTPALSPTRESEVGAEDITIGADEDANAAKGKRSMVRPVASSIGGV